MAVLSETAIRDAWCRWSELRPPDLEWQVLIELVQDRTAWEVPLVQATPYNGPKPGGHVARVQLLGAPRLSWTADQERKRPVLAEWTVVPGEVIAVIDALTAAWGTELIDHVLDGHGHSLELWVWRRVTG